jgi:hypothetical protein
MSDTNTTEKNNSEKIGALEKGLEIFASGLNSINGKIDKLIEAQTEFTIQSAKNESRHIQVLEQMSNTQKEIRELRKEYRSYVKNNDDRVSENEKLLLLISEEKRIKKEIEEKPWSIQKKIFVTVAGSVSTLVTLAILAMVFK